MISIYSSIRETLIPSCSFFANLRCSLSTTVMLCRGSRSGKHRPTRNRTKPLTYEMSVAPHLIGVRKSWLTWNTSNLEEFGIGKHLRVAEDEVIRRMIRGIMHNVFVTELVIKRRANMIIVNGIVLQSMTARKMYWLIGFTEELLSLTLKQPVKLEVQSVTNKQDVVFKYI